MVTMRLELGDRRQSVWRLPALQPPTPTSFYSLMNSNPHSESRWPKDSASTATANDNRRHVLSEDLRGIIAGDVLVDEVSLAQYSNDASLFQVPPLAIVHPRGHDDVVAIARYCSEHHLPMVPRGAGSGLAGESIGSGLVIDFSHWMTGIIAVGRDTVTVQPGVVLSDLNRHLQRYGRMFGPDPNSRGYTTIGGSIARDAAGSHWPAAGSCGDHLQQARLVLANGDSVELGSLASSRTNEDRSAKLLLQSQMAALLEKWQSKIKSPSTMPTAGYRFREVELSREIDLLPLLPGSEGTLGMITEVTLKTLPIPAHRGVVLLFFSRITDAAKVCEKLGRLPISACDLVDRRLLSIARESDARFQDLLPAAAEAMLLVEASNDDLNALNETLRQVVHSTEDQLSQSLPYVMTTDDEQRGLCWHLVRRIIPTLYRLKGSTRAIPYMDDILVPPRHLEQFFILTQELFNQAQVTTSLFAHGSQGRVHLRPLIDIGNPEQVQLLDRLTSQLYSRVWHMGGTIGTHGGLGFSRTPYFRKESGDIYPLHQEIKRIFDPAGLLNPGKIIQNSTRTHLDKIRPVHPIVVCPLPGGADIDQTNGLDLNDNGASTDQEPRAGLETEAVGGWPAQEEVRPTTENGDGISAPYPTLPILEPELDWDAGALTQAVRNCNGCGRCRTGGDLERMCPVFRVERSEESSPRAKANVLRGIMTGLLDPQQLASDEMKALTDTCINCHQCRIDCPAGVDIPKIANEIRAHYWATNGLKLSERLLNRLDILFRWASLAPTAANFLNSRRWSRWLLAKLLGIAPNRRLPRFHRRTFLSWARRRRLDRFKSEGGRRVVLFTDAFVNWNDPELGKALVAVLEHNGVAVSAPQNQKISALSLISAGALGPARKLAAANVAILAEAVRAGAKVITPEPAAALAIKEEYRNILDDPDAELVAENTYEATEYLRTLLEEGELKTDFRPIEGVLVHHLPCHQRVTVKGNPGVELLQLIPGLQVVPVEKGCSGMAGMFGVYEKNYWRSLKIGHELIREVRSSNYVAGTTECSTCRMQMEQGTSKPTVHPIKILARAYGLMPELEDIFDRVPSTRLLR